MENSNQTMPANNMALSIVGTILGMCSPFCCPGLILGIVAIVFSSQVKKKFESGDFEGAEKSAKNAKLLALIAIGLGVLGIIYSIFTWDQKMEQYQMIMEQYNLNQ